MVALLYIAATAALMLINPVTLWVMYLAVMCMDAANGKSFLPSNSGPFMKVVLYTGYFVDFACNVTWATLIFLDPPRELLVTSRLERYKYGGSTTFAYQKSLAIWMGDTLLDPFAPDGQHLKP